MGSGTTSALFILAILLVLLPSQVHAFGAGSMFPSFYFCSACEPEHASVGERRLDIASPISELIPSLLNYSLRHRFDICSRGQKLAPWRYRRHREGPRLHQGT